MSRPLFSTIIPVYNRAGLIEQTLGTVFAQDRPDLDIIVVDDGSTDDTVSILKEYGDCITLIQQANQGPGAARNAGIEKAKGEYVAFLDSDDLWFPWTLECYADCIEAHDRPSFLAGQPYLFSDGAGLENVEPGDVSRTYFRDYLASGDEWRWWSVSSFVIRTDVLRNAGGFTSQWMNAEDADLTLRIGTAPGFVDVSGGPTFAYREHDGTAMDVSSNTIKGALHLIESEKGNRYPGGPSRRLERLRILCRHVRPAALACLRGTYRSEAWQMYRDTFDWHVRLGRWKFLAGFLARAVQSRFQPSTL